MIHIGLNVNPPNHHHHQYIKENEKACIQGLKSHIFHCVIKSPDQGELPRKRNSVNIAFHNFFGGHIASH